MNDHETALRSSQGNLPHTPAPWYWDSDSVKGDPWQRLRFRVCALGRTITQIYMHSKEGEQAEADARRIVACVNSCEGVSTEVLERSIPLKQQDWYVERGALYAERDALRALVEQHASAFHLQALISKLDKPQFDGWSKLETEARAILAKAKQ